MVDVGKVFDEKGYIVDSAVAAQVGQVLADYAKSDKSGAKRESKKSK